MFSNLPPVTKALIIANGLVFLMQKLLGDPTFAPFCFGRWGKRLRPVFNPDRASFRGSS